MAKVVHPNGDRFAQFILQIKRNGMWTDIASASSLEAILIQEDDMHEGTFITTRLLSERESGKRFLVGRDYTIPRD